MKFGEYNILRKLGRKETGTVFLASHATSGQTVTIKVLPAGFSQDAEAVKDFQIEAKAITKFDHPNIVRIYSVNNEEGNCYVVREYIPGLPLSDVIEILKNTNEPRKLNAASVREILRAQESIVPERTREFWDMPYFQFVATIGSEIADALSYAHKENIVHGDLRTSNILLTREAVPKVAGFGLAVNIKKIESSKSGLPAEINEKTDIRSLGVILYELSNFRNSSTAGSAAHAKGVPIKLKAIILKCLERDPEYRYGSMSDVSRDLNNYLLSKPIDAKAVRILEKTVRSLRQNPIVAFLIFCLSFSVIVSAFVFLNSKISDTISKGVNYYNQYNNNEALASYYNAMELIKFSPFSKYRQKELYCYIGNALNHKGDYQAAIGYYEKAAAIDPDYLQAISGLASAYYKYGHFDEAITYCKIGNRLSPNDRNYYYWLGKSLASKGLFDEAIANYCKAIALAPSDFEALSEILSVLTEKGIYQDEEIKEYLKQIGLNNAQIESALSIQIKPPQNHLK